MPLHPPIRLDDLRWIRRSRKNLSNKRIWIQRNRRHQLLQLFRRRFAGRSRRLLVGLASRTVGLHRHSELHEQTAEQYSQNVFLQFHHGNSPVLTTTFCIPESRGPRSLRDQISLRPAKSPCLWLSFTTRRGMAAKMIATNTNSRRTIVHALLLWSAWRELLEHFVHALIQVLDVFVGVVGERVAFRSSPDQLLGLAIKEIDNHRANFVRVGRGRSLTKTSATEAPPTPAPSHSVVKRIEGLLSACDLHCHDRNIAAGVHLRPAFCR